MTFYVGQKVVCIRDDWAKEKAIKADAMPVKDLIYTIENIYSKDDEFYLRLVELPRVPLSWLERLWFWTRKKFVSNWYQSIAFRPLVEKKTDISIFQEIAKSPGVLTAQPEEVV